MDYSNVPTVVFANPPIGSVGLSEQKAIKDYGIDKIKVYRSKFTSMHYALSPVENPKSQSFFKVVCLLPDEKLIGIHCIGKGVDEMMQGFAIAIKAGATK